MRHKAQESFMAKYFYVVFLSLVFGLAGCYAPSFSGTMPDKQESVMIAEKVVKEVKSINLRVHPGEKCWVGDSEVRADYVQGKVSAAGTASTACQGTQY
jgi:hypothetical protein